MRYEMIVARDVVGAVGRKNTLPWKCASDMAHFKERTMGKVVVMGSTTFASMGNRPLKGRLNIVLTSKPRPLGNSDKNLRFASSLGDVDNIIAAAVLDKHPYADDGVMIIGGPGVYGQYLDRVSTIHESWMDTVVEDADAFFPNEWFDEFETVRTYITTRVLEDTCNWLYRVWERKA